MSALTDPPFAANPPVKVNVNAKTLGLVLLILGAIGILFGLLGLIGTLTICGGLSVYGGCGFPIIWTLGELVGLVGVIVGTIGAYRMYQLNPQGKELVIYGLILGFIGAVISLIGDITFYSGFIGGAVAGGAIFGLVIDAIIYGIVYYLVVVSRFPGQAPLVAPGGTSWGGPSSPPPPPPV